MIGNRLRWAAMALGAALTLGACDTLESHTVAETRIAAPDLHWAFNAIKQAALGAGFTIVSENEELGTLQARRESKETLVFHDPQLWITLRAENGSFGVEIESAVSGQLVDYGETRQATEDFCKALQLTMPAADCSYSG